MQKKQTHIMYGFISGIIMAVVSLIIYLTGLTFKPGMEYIQYVAYIPFLVGILLNAMAYSKANDGFVTFGNVFGSCFKAAMLVTIVIIAWSVISMLVFPEMKEKALNMARDKMASSSRKMTDEQMDMALNMTKKYFTTFMIAGVIFGTLFYGAIFSLIGGLVAQKKGPAPITSSNF